MVAYWSHPKVVSSGTGSCESQVTSGTYTLEVGRTRVHQPPDLFCAVLHFHWYYENIYGTRPVTRELQHGLVWYYCGPDKPSSRDTIDRFLTDLKHVIDDVFDRVVEQAAVRGLLDSTYSLDSTWVEPIQCNDAASWSYPMCLSGSTTSQLI